MGRAPQDKIFKKLVSAYLKVDFGSAQYNSANSTMSNMVNINMSRDTMTKDLLLKKHTVKNEIIKKMEKEKKELEELKAESKTFPTLASQYLYKAKHKGQKKGRHHIRADHYTELKKDLEILDV